MAVKINELYICKNCGILLEALHPGAGDPVCCGEPMTRLDANTVDASHEKHVPVIKRYGNICHVQVGSEQHPMTVEHHIAWIEIHFNERVIRKKLNPGEKPEAEFCGIPEDAKVSARIFCNLHGLWKACPECID